MAAVRTRAKPRSFNYRYTAAAAGGRIVRGTIKAPSEVVAQDLLVERGQTPINLEVAPSTFSLEGQLPQLFAVKEKDVINFSRQLATLLDAGITLLPALQLLGGQGSVSRPFRRIIATMAQDLGTGRSLSQAVARHPKVFDEIYSRTIAVGEKTGKLEGVLREVADHMERSGAFAKKVSGALTYPIIVLVVGGLVGLILITVALPPLVDMFKTLNVELPLPTRILLGISGFMGATKLYLLTLFLVGVPLGVWFLRQRSGKRAMDKFRMRAPLMGKIYHMAELARLCRSISMMLGAGLSLQEVVEALPLITTNTVLREALVAVQRGLLLGQGLTYPLSLHPEFPPLFLQMVRVGEESNSLESNLRVLAVFYENTASEQAATMVALIQPLSTIAIAFVAGFIALSVIMPMYSITGSF
ncbi:MAG: type II secretion system F family protein [Chloroflexi bacterium]|nr:type II secretion system F family protein [Chloroflexota bacterium]